MMRNSKETAALLAIVLKRSGQTRARVSGSTIKLLGGRQNLRSAFVLEVSDALADYDWILFELNAGGYGAVQARALEAAKSVTAKRFLNDDERRAIRRSTSDLQELLRQAKPEEEEPGDDD
jgi:hypothetical protein